MHSYETSTEALDDLKKRGFMADFNMLQQDNFKDAKVKETYRFEGMTNPEDEEIVLAIELENGEQGTLVSAYGFYADSNIELIKYLGIVWR